MCSVQQVRESEQSNHENITSNAYMQTLQLLFSLNCFYIS